VKKARTLFAAKPATRRRREEVLSDGTGSDPFRHPIPTVESTSVFGKARSFAGAQSERRPWPAMRTCRSTRMGLHPISHASQATRGARKSQRGGTAERKLRRVSRGRKAARSSLSLSSFGLRASHVLRTHLKGVARRGGGSRASGARLSRSSVGEIARSSLRRIELGSSLHSKEEDAGSVKSASCAATLAGQSPAAGEDDARGVVLVCRTLKTRCRSRKAATGPEKRPHR